MHHIAGARTGGTRCRAETKPRLSRLPQKQRLRASAARICHFITTAPTPSHAAAWQENLVDSTAPPGLVEGRALSAPVTTFSDRFRAAMPHFSRTH
jgi:hypothetical protein